MNLKLMEKKLKEEKYGFRCKGQWLIYFLQ